MRILLINLLFFITFSTFATENYAVVTNKNTELMNKEGYIVQKVRKGTVLKVSDHPKDDSAVVVNFEGKTFFSASRNFKVIESLLDEEVIMIKRVALNREKITNILADIKDKNAELLENKEKTQRINRWIEVQRDNAFSVEYFKAKTTKASVLLKDLIRKETLLKLEKETLVNELDDSKYELNEDEFILKALQQKLKPLKAEKSLFDKGFMTIEVIAKYAPVFYEGKIVKYLNKNSQLKVGVDHMSGDWYVLTKGQKRFYIASADARIKF